MTDFNIATMAQKAKKASRVAAQLNSSEKNALLNDIATAIENNSDAIIQENSKDIAAGQEKGLSQAMLDRLVLTDKGIKDMSSAIREIVALTLSLIHI